ncbi:MAG: hypothetical protein ACKO0V_18990, partial [bacterium]
PLRLAVLPAIVLATLFLLRPAPILPAIALPGVDASVVNSLTMNELRQVLESLTKESLADSEKTTPRAIVELIAQSELNPANTRSNDLINQIVQREDLDQSVAQVGGVIGQSRHLDFLILFRDFLLLQEKAKNNPQEVGQVEWQSLESRFMKHQAKWPAEIRAASLLAHFASMRSDFDVACLQIDIALEQMIKQGLGNDTSLAIDLRQRKILYTETQAQGKQRNNQPVEAAKKYAEALKLIHEFRMIYPEVANREDMADFLAKYQVESTIGQGDAETDQQKFDKALEFYRSSELLLTSRKDQFVLPSFEESVRQQLERRIETLIQLKKDGLTVNPCD